MKPTVFYVKWTGTFGSMLTVFLTSHDYIPYNKYAGLMTAIVWTISGFLWNEAALVVPNIVIALIYLSGILK